MAEDGQNATLFGTRSPSSDGINNCHIPSTRQQRDPQTTERQLAVKDALIQARMGTGEDEKDGEFDDAPVSGDR